MSELTTIAEHGSIEIKRAENGEVVIHGPGLYLESDSYLTCMENLGGDENFHFAVVEFGDVHQAMAIAIDANFRDWFSEQVEEIAHGINC